MTRRFITFEGIDGAGKSTHVEPLAQTLRSRGHRVLCTREPGGTVLAEHLRRLVLQEPMDGVTETLLVFAARRDHAQRVILPALAGGEIVLCDRFTDSTFAYQGGGRGQPLEVLAALEDWVHDGLQPELTVWFDVEPRIAAQRRADARSADRFEAEDLAFFERVRAAYVARMRGASGRFVRVDSVAERDVVRRQVEEAVLALPGMGGP
ncbi:MAG TPA: dTMP kinase [Caldimonas sp.]|jgi:dTMP kinase|nr:dTMP kinase [Caldimonas sp.]HEX2541543.1 dTMP kinase [Caldimonas sp.]